ncbi:MAG: hypothetical protein K1X72_12985 [Pyrinomonadaceae bacterium]|nr:hypothetical protein [Pyrinomonadaceae bacterium]
MFYVLICISLTFVGIAAMQFLYLFYLERVEIEHKKKIKELERRCKDLMSNLRDAEFQIAEQSKIIEELSEQEEEVWADVIDDKKFKA